MPGFAWAQGEPRAGAPVDFEDTSLGGPTSWSWDFGDGHTSTDVNPTHVYAETGIYTVTLTVANATMTEIVRRPLKVRERSCAGSGRALCVNEERFQVEITWRDFEGNTGSGTVAPAGSNDSGLFWFFEEDNWEMLVKVLDGCALNQRYWVFAAATTNVEYTLRVVDTHTGFVSEYLNPLGTSAGAITDTAAFATCADGASDTPRNRLLVPASDAAARVRHTTDLQATSTGGCADTADGLCLNRDRFLVEVEWTDFEGDTGTGSAVPFGTADSGLLWFFDKGNWEMLVKVLDGCGLNQQFWVFSAATTDVGYTLRVTDTETGEVREYVNELGRRAPAVTDIEAFATCP